MTERHKPGEKAPHSGQYPIIDPKRGNTGVERTVTRGEPFPPTPKKGQTYGRPDKTKHQVNFPCRSLLLHNTRSISAKATNGQRWNSHSLDWGDSFDAIN